MSRFPGVCIFTETYHPVVGGGESQARALAASLEANGFNVNVLTRRSNTSLKKNEKFGMVTVYRLPPVGSGHYKKWGMLFTSLPMLIKLRRDYDLIFVSGFRVLGFPAVLVSRILRKACVLKADSLGEMSGDFFRPGLARLGFTATSLLFKSFLRLRNSILKRADSFVAISSEVASELITSGVNPNKIKMIPNSVDTYRFCPVNFREKQELRRKLGLSAKDTIVIFTGRLVSYKGLPLLLRAWQVIQAKHHNISLLLVGSGGLDIHNCEAELKMFVVENDLQESVSFTGDVYNVHEYLQASDIFVFPTEREAFGISLIEAMACGLPVVSTAAGGVKDVINHRENALVVKPGNLEQLYCAIDILITDSNLSACLGNAAWQSVQVTYSAETVTRQYAELFGSISNTDRAGPEPIN
jgi:glycosyltransferase involved in cell wall biosynthesis